MKVATWRGNDRFTLDEAPEPVAGPGQVVVAVRAAGICGTDIHATQGLFPWTPPLVMGHEYTGVVREVGRGVNTVAGRARRGLRALVRLRRVRRVRGGPDQPVREVRTAWAASAERVALPARAVHPLPPELDPVTAALTEPAACCLSGLEMYQMPRERHGARDRRRHHGPAHDGAGRAARRQAADPLRSHRGAPADRQAPRRGDRRSTPRSENLRERMMALTKGRGADVVCEAVGKPSLVAEALTLVKPTGVVQLVGVSPKGSQLPLDLWDTHFREVRIHGAFGRGTAFRRALKLMPSLGVGQAGDRALPPRADRRGLRPRRRRARGEDGAHAVRRLARATALGALAALALGAGCRTASERFRERATARGLTAEVVAGASFQHLVLVLTGTLGADAAHLSRRGRIPVRGRLSGRRPHAARSAGARSHGARSRARGVRGPPLLSRPWHRASCVPALWTSGRYSESVVAAWPRRSTAWSPRAASNGSCGSATAAVASWPRSWRRACPRPWGSSRSPRTWTSTRGATTRHAPPRRLTQSRTPAPAVAQPLPAPLRRRPRHQRPRPGHPGRRRPTPKSSWSPTTTTAAAGPHSGPASWPPSTTTSHLRDRSGSRRTTR